MDTTKRQVDGRHHSLKRRNVAATEKQQSSEQDWNRGWSGILLKYLNRITKHTLKLLKNCFYAGFFCWTKNII